MSLQQELQHITTLADYMLELSETSGDHHMIASAYLRQLVFLKKQHHAEKQKQVQLDLPLDTQVDILRFALAQALPLARHTLQQAFHPVHGDCQCPAQQVANLEGFDSREAANEWLETMADLVGVKP